MARRDLSQLPPRRKRFVEARSRGLAVEKAGILAGICTRSAWNYEKWLKARLAATTGRPG